MLISSNLARFVDTCNVYLLRSGREAVLVDFGSGDVLDNLAEFGVDRVTDVLLTHHHRDQAQGLARAHAQGIRIWVPPVERELFDAVDEHWQAREIYNDYNVREDRFSLLEPVPVTGALPEYRSRGFGEHELYILPTPGHTVGSISLLGDVDGRRVAFTGDLIAAPGKVWSLAATQWSYTGGEGLASSVLSLSDLRDREPELLLPAHGEPMDDAPAALTLTEERLAELIGLRGRHYLWLNEFRRQPWIPITPHLLHNRTSLAYSYALLSESGRALLIDFGYDYTTGVPAGPDRSGRRPLLYTTPTLKRQYGLERLDVVLPTHYHDDHVAGFNLLRDIEGTQVWAAETIAPILEHPERHDLPCLWFDPIPVDRVLPLDTPIRWEEYELTLYELPGHTLYAVAIAFQVDGTRVVATGDQQDEEWLNYVYRNRFRARDYVASAELYLRLRPDLFISGHWPPRWVDDDYLEHLRVRGARLERLHHELQPPERVDAEARGCRLEPYQIDAADGQPVALGVVLHNPYRRPETVHAELALPDGWHAEPDVRSLELAGGATGRTAFRVTPHGGAARRVRIGLDVTIGERGLGQVAEALVTLR